MILANNINLNKDAFIKRKMSKEFCKIQKFRPLKIIGKKLRREGG